jgi:DNA-binding NtrC family response regulator
MNQILIIEDEEVIRSALQRLLSRRGFKPSVAGSVEEALANWDPGDFDLIIADVRLPGAPGTEIIPRAQGVPVLIMTSYASVRSAWPVKGMVGHCAAMEEVCRRIGKVAPTDSTVLILGESGTGKELVARAVHDQSLRRDAPFVTVNCAAIPEPLIESELFGHEKGAFTGAASARTGLVESADGGTLFLDEIGELPMAAQSRLLRVLQNGEIRRVGSEQSRQVDVRLLAATHRDLKQRVQDSEFRGDLYFRLRVVELNLPPLRERGADIEELARFLLEKTCKQLNKALMELPGATLAVMQSYDWPGNVRELENALERAVILCDDGIITPELLAIEHRATTIATPSPADSSPQDLSLEDYFKQFVLAHQDRLTETALAKQLGISRKALWERRQRFGIPRPKH